MRKLFLTSLIGVSFALFSCQEVKVGGITIFDPHGGEKALRDFEDMGKQDDLVREVAWQVAYNGKDYTKIDGRLKAKGKFLKYDNQGCALVRVEVLRYDEEMKMFTPLTMERKRVCLGN